MGNNYQDYALLKTDDPLEQCILYFWDSLEDEIYPKEFLEHLLQLSDDVRTGKEEVIPMDEVMDRLTELVKDVELNEDTWQTGTRALHRCPFWLYNDFINKQTDAKGHSQT